ncbi:hypothetical protein [Luteolibacter sp. Populi]|uniref:hypothetical protein n=1 Tax=Luteolibacter sp. Populi TaxID=3230487 RepID=UPI0034658BD6
MSAKIVSSFFIGLLVGVLLAWGGAKPGGDRSQPSAEAGGRTAGGGAAGDSIGESATKPGERAPKTDKKVDVLLALDGLARQNPALIRKLDLRLFDYDFEMLPADWEALGLPETKAEELKSALLQVFDRVHELESKSFKVTSAPGEDLVLEVPALSADASAAIVAQIKETFGEVLPAELAAVLAETYVKSNLSTTGSLVGRGRIMKIVPASAEDFKQFGFKYNLHTQVLREKTGFDEAKTNPAGSVYLTSDWPVDDIPVSWRHLVADP